MWQAAYTQDLMVVAWKDNKAVYLASNCDGIEPMQECQRYSKAEKRYLTLPQPMVVRKYNTSMGGVDLLDNGVKNYSIQTRIRKWYWPMYSWFLGVNMVQAWRLFRATMTRRHATLQQEQVEVNLAWEEKKLAEGMTRAAVEKAKKEREKEQNARKAEQKKLEEMGQLEFIRQVVEVTLKKHASAKRKLAQAPRLSAAALQAVRFDNGKHLIHLTQVAGVCKECKGRTKFRCKRCDVALHAEHCFYKYHGGEDEED